MSAFKKAWPTYVNPDAPPIGKTQREKDAEWLAAGHVPAPPKIVCVVCGAGMLRDRVAMFKFGDLWLCEKHKL